MSSVIIIAAGSDITTSLADLWRLLRFPRLWPSVHLRLRQMAVLCVMFHCKNNKTMCQENPAQEAGHSVKETSVWVKTPALLTPLPLRSESAVTMPGSRTSLMTTDLRGCFTYRTYGGRQGGRMRSFSRSIAQFIPRQDPESASLHSKGGGSDPQSNESHIYLVLKEELQHRHQCGSTTKLLHVEYLVENVICNFIYSPK